MRFARDGHVLSHRLDNFDESTPYRWQVGFSSEDDSDWAKPRQFGPWLGIPGPALTRRPGMTTRRM
jgi:hypothetical protein